MRVFASLIRITVISNEADIQQYTTDTHSPRGSHYAATPLRDRQMSSQNFRWRPARTRQDKPSQAKRQRQDKRRQDNRRQDNIRQDKRRQENTSQGKTIRNTCRLGQSSLFSSLQIGSLEFHGTIVVFLIDISFCLCAEETIG